MILFYGIFSAFRHNVIDFGSAAARPAAAAAEPASVIVTVARFFHFMKGDFYVPEQSGRHHHWQCLKRCNET